MKWLLLLQVFLGLLLAAQAGGGGGGGGDDDDEGTFTLSHVRLLIGFVALALVLIAFLVLAMIACYCKSRKKIQVNVAKELHVP